MRNILAQAHREFLRQFACSNALLAFDYDGTLAPIVAQPERAMMRPRTRALLEDLVKLYPCVVISGRSQRDAMRRLHGIGVHEIIGNHGVEPWHASKKMVDEVERWRPKLEEALKGFAGVVIENKEFSVAVHYRMSREKKKALAAIHAAAHALGEVRLIGGKQVVNILPKDAPHKGMALERERARLKCDTAIYVGDDETDEDVFALDQPGQLLSIRVGQRRASAAPYFIDGQRTMDALLRTLLTLRQEAGIARPPWGGN